MREEQKNFSKRDYKGLERLKRFRKKAWKGLLNTGAEQDKIAKWEKGDLQRENKQTNKKTLFFQVPVDRAHGNCWWMSLVSGTCLYLTVPDPKLVFQSPQLSHKCPHWNSLYLTKIVYVLDASGRKSLFPKTNNKVKKADIGTSLAYLVASSFLQFWTQIVA